MACSIFGAKDGATKSERAKRGRRSPRHPLRLRTPLQTSSKPPRQLPDGSGVSLQIERSSRLPPRRPVTSLPVAGKHVGGSAHSRGRRSCLKGYVCPGAALPPPARRRYGSPGVLPLAQPQVPVHHRQLRRREGEGSPATAAENREAWRA